MQDQSTRRESPKQYCTHARWMFELKRLATRPVSGQRPGRIFQQVTFRQPTDSLGKCRNLEYSGGRVPLGGPNAMGDPTIWYFVASSAKFHHFSEIIGGTYNSKNMRIVASLQTPSLLKPSSCQSNWRRSFA